MTGTPEQVDYQQLAAEIMERCEVLGRISADPDHLVRVHLTAEHKIAANQVEEWMKRAGLQTWTDAAGNVCGRNEFGRGSAPALLLGSHIDTVPDAGKYDGPLGVLLAIAVAELINNSGSGLDVPLELVAFSDEEGTRFGNGLSGSYALAGAFEPAWWDYTDADGITFRQAAIDYGLDPDKVNEAARRADELVGYLEAHIEQGPLLEDADLALGVVSSIATGTRHTVTITGQAGHAGGTPYDRRHDALVGASELVVGIEQICSTGGTIGTVGRLQVYPGGVNVIPGRVEFSLDLRAETSPQREAALAEIEAAAAEIAGHRGLGWEIEQFYTSHETACAPWLQGAIAAGIRATGQSEAPMIWSRAGHDGMAIDKITDIAMLFIRCAGGISHAPQESVTVEDVALALEAYEEAVRRSAAAAVAR
ncbi:Zn-dependent hydrolase [Microlunatus endophyticus]|uniref:Zn-dependent hydrolase n=1 Tax=Microlunatus endophyticus TaxID=1716077 RepID=A0A917SDQ1_9ACTN|nr:allantoate amidohydrolase [Microlunatus endophyticus]GGL74918.1 Zn-dependent hydrolase [Microlunatus endophyticus]